MNDERKNDRIKSSSGDINIPPTRNVNEYFYHVNNRYVVYLLLLSLELS